MSLEQDLLPSLVFSTCPSRKDLVDVLRERMATAPLAIVEEPIERRIEAVYAFPLPANAAVHESAIRIGDRLVVAEGHGGGDPGVWACRRKNLFERRRRAHYVVGEVKKDGIERSGDIGRLQRRLQQRDVSPAGLDDPLPGEVHHLGADLYPDHLAFATDRQGSNRGS